MAMIALKGSHSMSEVNENGEAAGLSYEDELEG